MKLNKNTYLIRYYRWFYDLNKRQLPKDLCSFFWKLVLAILCAPLSLLFTIFGTIGAFELNMLFRITSHYYYEEDACYMPASFGESLYTGIFGLFVTGLITVLILFAIMAPLPFALTIGGIVIITGIMLLLHRLVRWFLVPKPGDNIIIEYIKAKKNNYCPRIEWTDDDKFPETE